jgi:hypothetical protein
MDGFALARHIALYTEETVSYNSIPSTLIGPYFPEEALPVTQFLQFKLPILRTSLHALAANLSQHPPSSNELSESDLRTMCSPPHSSIKKLISQYDSDHNNLARSVSIGSRYIPINTLQIWETLFRLHDLQQAWKESQVRVEQMAGCHPTQQHAILETQKRLLSCHWNTRVQGFSKSVSSTIGGLMRYLSISCLTTTDMTLHLDLLCNNLESGNVRACLLSPLHIQYLSGCGRLIGKNGLERYRNDRTYLALRQLGSKLVSGSISQFGGIMLVNGNHWIGFLISSAESTIYLADSLYHRMEDINSSCTAKEATEILQWWLDASNLESNQHSTPFQAAWLPTAHQKDSSSCGFFALNALMHHLLPEKYSLSTDDNDSVVGLRVGFLGSILEHHMAHVRTKHTFND